MAIFEATSASGVHERNVQNGLHPKVASRKPTSRYESQQTSWNAVSRERLNAYERGLGEQYSLHASDPHMGWDDSGTKALVGSQFVLARDVEFSRAASLTFVSWNGSARGSL